MPLFDPRTHPAAVILLAFVLAAGFLLVILSCALWNNWLPLLVGTFSSQAYIMARALTNSTDIRHGSFT
jgi:1,4-dihydroxy-2-naphthoate octaprenyltransferase